MRKVNLIYVPLIIGIGAISIFLVPKVINAQEVYLQLNANENLIALSEESKQNEESLLERYISEQNGEYRCERQLDSGITVTSHHYSEWAVMESSCVQNGYERYVCDICHREVSENYPLKDHVIVDGVCINCGKSEASVEYESMVEQIEEPQWDIESAYENYLRMPNETMRTSYLESLSEENRNALIDYIEKSIVTEEKEEVEIEIEQEPVGDENEE